MGIGECALAIEWGKEVNKSNTREIGKNRGGKILLRGDSLIAKEASNSMFKFKEVGG